jgi:hypothetical protein
MGIKITLAQAREQSGRDGIANLYDDDDDNDGASDDSDRSQYGSSSFRHRGMVEAGLTT